MSQQLLPFASFFRMLVNASLFEFRFLSESIIYKLSSAVSGLEMGDLYKLFRILAAC